MDLSAPFPAMFPTVDSAVLTVLTASLKPRTGREIARLAGKSQTATQRVLDRLVAHGLVLRKDAGRARVYEFNWEHLAAEPISELTDLRQMLFYRLREVFELWPLSPYHASVFGSAARGDGGLDSDVDIFLVRPPGIHEDDERWQAQVGSLASGVFEWTGNHAGIVEVGKEELEQLRRNQPAIVRSMRADAVDVAGTPVQSLLKRV